MFTSFSIYSTRKIITRSYYILYPLFEVQKYLLKGFFFLKTLALCTVCNQMQVIMARVMALPVMEFQEQGTLISLINVESTITNFEKFHPPQKQNPASTFIDFLNIFQPPRLFQPPCLHNLLFSAPFFYSLGSSIRQFFLLK